MFMPTPPTHFSARFSVITNAATGRTLKSCFSRQISAPSSRQWRGHHKLPAFEIPLDRVIKTLWTRQSDQMKDVSDMLAKQRIENRVAVAREIVSEPPHPIAAFGNEELFICKIPVVRRNEALTRHQCFACPYDPGP